MLSAGGWLNNLAPLGCQQLQVEERLRGGPCLTPGSGNAPDGGEREVHCTLRLTGLFNPSLGDLTDRQMDDPLPLQPSWFHLAAPTVPARPGGMLVSPQTLPRPWCPGEVTPAGLHLCPGGGCLAGGTSRACLLLKDPVDPPVLRAAAPGGATARQRRLAAGGCASLRTAKVTGNPATTHVLPVAGWNPTWDTPPAVIGSGGPGRGRTLPARERIGWGRKWESLNVPS